MRWRGRNVVLLLFLAGILIPMQMVLLPLFTIYFHIHLIDTLWALIITYTAFGLPLTVFLMASYFRALPREILEAATFDGASIYQLVLADRGCRWSRNAIFTVALVQFFFIWNDLLLSLTFISSEQQANHSDRAAQLHRSSTARSSGAPTFAAVSMTVIPTLLLYLVLNKRVMSGLTAGGVKG